MVVGSASHRAVNRMLTMFHVIFFLFSPLGTEQQTAGQRLSPTCSPLSATKSNLFASAVIIVVVSSQVTPFPSWIRPTMIGFVILFQRYCSRYRTDSKASVCDCITSNDLTFQNTNLI